MPTGLFDTLDWSLDCALEALLFTFILVCLCQAARQVSSASARHCVLTVALLFCVVAPFVPLVASSWWGPSAAALGQESPGQSEMLPLLRQCYQDFVAGRIPLVYTIALVVVAIWAIGTLLMLGKRFWHLGAAEYESWKLQRDGQKIALSPSLLKELNDRCQLNTDLSVVAVPDRESASVQGLFFPVITVSSEFENLPQPQQLHILLHETAHIRRKDLWTSELAHVATALYWIVPIVWWAARRLRVEAERCCDDSVLERGVSASDYAETLIAAFDRQTGQSIGGKTALPSTASRKFVQRIESSEKQRSAGSPVSSFHERLLSIIDPRLPRSANRFLIAVSLGCTLLLGTCVARSNLIARSHAPVGSVTITATINSTSDDAEEFYSVGRNIKNSQGKVFLSNRDLELGYDASHGACQILGLRFTGIDIPYRAKIEKASIVFVADSEGVGDRVELLIRCEQSAFPATFHVSPRNISKRVEKNLNSVHWAITKLWIDGEVSTSTETPELSSLVQELVSLPDWKRGRDMVFVFEPSGTSCKQEFYRDGVSFDSERGTKKIQAPVLKITYSAW